MPKIRCAAVLAAQYRHQQPWVRLCEQAATMRADGVPLCGTHINHPPNHVMTRFGGYATTEALCEGGEV